MIFSLQRSHPHKNKKIDWEQIKKQIENSRKIFEEGLNFPTEKKNEILHERAKIFAQEIKASDENYIEILTFIIGNEAYGIETSFIREVSQLKELTPIPGLPHYFIGVTNVRGKILTVVDLKKFFELPEKDITDLNKLVVLQSENIEFGILADSIIGTADIKPADLQSDLPTLTGIRSEFLKGVTKDHAIILDGAKILSYSRIIKYEPVNK